MNSERKQREVVKNLQAVKIMVESVPSSFLTRHGCQEIRPAPLACVTDFAGVVFHLLEEKNRYTSCCTHACIL